MLFGAAPCSVCGQGVVREARRFRERRRVVCGSECRRILNSKSWRSNGEHRHCLRCGEGFVAPPHHIGVSLSGGADVCPACWAETSWVQEDDAQYLDMMASLFASLSRLLLEQAREYWFPRLACPRCGDPARRTYEWDCRYPLAVGLCEGFPGPHVHSVCYRCGYETVRLQKKTPRRLSDGGPCHGRGAIMSSFTRASRSPDSTTSRR